ncbi:predicted protein [Chaetomium globosum CBS 148.51]|uniref:Uncharacterized protein n=1 Tax=Chaetomium globosum (strain ATCC 6205 / CBS 148.51 / DSM 1962 / NBRC 6347 / NRRL 1970) TaxID=306901 RepID=Q2H409_CHAGB|nr:uncharacterized protein CHGG_06606 [Chaetomium globosum CBS 148.51]EAQ89987.1 predicted protein [Chaetomium globosum CBS 148.51]
MSENLAASRDILHPKLSVESREQEWPGGAGHQSKVEGRVAEPSSFQKHRL